MEIEQVESTFYWSVPVPVSYALLALLDVWLTEASSLTLQWI